MVTTSHFHVNLTWDEHATGTFSFKVFSTTLNPFPGDFYEFTSVNTQQSNN